MIPPWDTAEVSDPMSDHLARSDGSPLSVLRHYAILILLVAAVLAATFVVVDFFFLDDLVFGPRDED
jgi:hypothetical protein